MGRACYAQSRVQVGKRQLVSTFQGSAGSRSSSQVQVSCHQAQTSKRQSALYGAGAGARSPSRRRHAAKRERSGAKRAPPKLERARESIRTALRSEGPGPSRARGVEAIRRVILCSGQVYYMLSPHGSARARVGEGCNPNPCTHQSHACIVLADGSLSSVGASGPMVTRQETILCTLQECSAGQEDQRYRPRPPGAVPQVPPKLKHRGDSRDQPLLFA